MSEQDNLILRLASSVKLFRGMTRPVLGQLISTAEKVTVPKGSVFFEEGELGESFHVLVGGQAEVQKLVDRQVVQLTTLRPGDVFGEMTLIGENARSATVRTARGRIADGGPHREDARDTRARARLCRGVVFTAIGTCLPKLGT